MWACDWKTYRETLFSLISLQCERAAPEAGQLGRSTVHLLVGLVAHVFQCPILALTKQDGRSSLANKCVYTHAHINEDPTNSCTHTHTHEDMHDKMVNDLSMWIDRWVDSKVN